MDKNDILKKLIGPAKEWNSWRENNRNVTISLKGVDLSGMDLRKRLLWELDLSGAKFNRTDLRDSSFEKSNLQNADFFGANLEGATFRDSDLRYAKLEMTNLQRADLLGSNLEGATLLHADVTNANFLGVKGNFISLENNDPTSPKGDSDLLIKISHLEDRMKDMSEKIEKKVDVWVFRLAIYFVITLISVGSLGLIVKLFTK